MVTNQLITDDLRERAVTGSEKMVFLQIIEIL
jgi:hypothetical protein